AGVGHAEVDHLLPVVIGHGVHLGVGCQRQAIASVEQSQPRQPVLHLQLVPGERSGNGTLAMLVLVPAITVPSARCTPIPTTRSVTRSRALRSKAIVMGASVANPWCSCPSAPSRRMLPKRTAPLPQRSGSPG